MKPLVLIDATPLRGISGLRGIGRYVRDLLYGLHACRAHWEGELRIAALYDLGFPRRWAVSQDLCEAADIAFAARGSAGPLLKQARRALIDGVAAREGAALLHMPEAVGTPLSRKVPRVVTCHDLIPLRYWRQYLGYPLARAVRLLRERARYRRAEHVICISERTASDLEELVGVEPARIQVVQHGIDLDNFAARADAAEDADKAAQLGLGSEPYVVYAGAADWRKNASGMFEALALARRERDVVMAWAGELPPEQLRSVERAAADAGVSRHVRLLGFVAESHMPALFRRALAHLLLSRLEGFGLTVVEAMAVGCPVIVARGSASDEVAGSAGIIVDPDDVSAASRAILRMASDTNAREELVTRGLERARHFDRVRMAADYARAYVGLLRGADASR